MSGERMRMLSTCLKDVSIMLGAYVEFFLLLYENSNYVEHVWMDIEYQRVRLDQLCNLCVSGPNPFYVLCFVMLGLGSANRVSLPVAFCYSVTKGVLQRTTGLEEKGQRSFFPFFPCQFGLLSISQVPPFFSLTEALHSYRSNWISLQIFQPLQN